MHRDLTPRTPAAQGAVATGTLAFKKRRNKKFLIIGKSYMLCCMFAKKGLTIVQSYKSADDIFLPNKEHPHTPLLFLKKVGLM